MHLKIAILPTENDTLTLMVDSPAGLLPAGVRLRRSKPLPDIAFSHTDPQKAIADCRKLQAYIDTHINHAKK